MHFDLNNLKRTRKWNIFAGFMISLYFLSTLLFGISTLIESNIAFLSILFSFRMFDDCLPLGFILFFSLLRYNFITLQRKTYCIPVVGTVVSTTLDLFPTNGWRLPYAIGIRPTLSYSYNGKDYSSEFFNHKPLKVGITKKIWINPNDPKDFIFKEKFFYVFDVLSIIIIGLAFLFLIFRFFNISFLFLIFRFFNISYFF